MPTDSRLKGLKGLSGLSPQERQAFMSANADKLSRYSNPVKREKAANILYMNQKFINTYGEDAFNAANDGSRETFDLRNEYLYNDVVSDSFKKKFQDSDDFGNLAQNLDIQGMYDLLTNEEYVGTKERKKRLSKDLKEAENAWFGKVGETVSAFFAQEKDKDIAEKDKEITDRLFNSTQQRREEKSQVSADSIYNSILNDDINGVKSLAQSTDEFDKLASKASPHYAEFKNTKWLKDYSNEDRLKDYSKYMALKNDYGEGVARQYLDRNIQNRIAEAQDGAFTGNTFKGLATIVWSDLGSNIALINNISDYGLDAEKFAILNQGKDPNKPIYDKNGTIVDYEENEDIFSNPAYWNDVYKYNTFSPTEIKAIKEKGGISEHVNIREYGHVPEFFSWETYQEAFKQGGHILAGVIETYATGGVGKIAGLAGKGIMTGLGVSAKNLARASKIGGKVNNFAVGMTAGLEGSQLEAMGTFEEQLQINKEKIQQQIEAELLDYERGIDYNNPEAQASINSYYNQLKAEDTQRVAAESVEGTQAYPLDDDTLKEQAKRLYTNDLLKVKQQELQELHKKDEQEAAVAATKAYGTNFALNYIKNNILSNTIQKYMVAKGSKMEFFDNSIGRKIEADADTGGIRRVLDKKGNAKRFASGKKLGYEVGKQLVAGFMDEYMDGINAAFGSGVGNNIFDNYIKRNYDPEAYSATTEGILGNFLSGLSEGIDGITDRQNLYEGAVGMLAPVVMARPKLKALYNGKNVWGSMFSGVDENGTELSFAERLDRLIANPLLSSMSELYQRDRRVDNTVSLINSVVEANKDNVNDISKLVSILGNYNSPLNPTILKDSSTGTEEMRENPLSLLDTKDSKLYNTFSLIETLNTLEAMEGGETSQLYQDTMQTLNGLAKGTLSEKEMNEQIDKFLAEPNNKSIENQADKRDIAAKRLKKNAETFLNMKNKISDIKKSMSNNPVFKRMDPRVKSMLTYNLLATDDYRERLKSLESELGVSSTNPDSYYTPNFEMRYGTIKSRKNAVAAREREITKLQKKQEDLDKSTKELSDDIKSTSKNLENTTDEKEKKRLTTVLGKQKSLLEAKKFQRKALDDRMKLLKGEKDAIAALSLNKDDLPEFTEEAIMNLDARDRFAILNPGNMHNFSSKQQGVINHVRKNLMQKDPDAMTKVQDAGILAQRVEDMKTVHDKIMNNDELAATYISTAEILRDRNAVAESVQRDLGNHYKSIEKGYKDREKNPQAFKNAVLAVHSQVAEAYASDHPEQQDAIQPYIDMLKFNETARAIIKGWDDPNELKLAMIQTLNGLQRQSETLKEFTDKIEGIIDSEDVDADTKKKYSDLLDVMEELHYQRNATIIQERQAREAKQQEKEEKEKLENNAEADTQDNTNTSVKEEQKTTGTSSEAAQVEAAKTAATTGTVNPEEDTRKSKDAQKAAQEETIKEANDVVGDPTEALPKPSIEEAKGMEGKDPSEAVQSNEGEDLSLSAKPLLEDKAKDERIPITSMWINDPEDSSNTKQRSFNVERKGDKIFFSNGNDQGLEDVEGDFLIINPEEIDFSEDSKPLSGKDLTNEEIFQILLSQKLGKISKEDVIERLKGTKYVYDAPYYEDGHLVSSKGREPNYVLSQHNIDDLIGEYFGKFLKSDVSLVKVVPSAAFTNTVIVIKDSTGKEYGGFSNFISHVKQGNQDYIDLLSDEGRKVILDLEDTQQPNEHNTQFYATSMEKKDGDWYFVGNFATDNRQVKVKAKKSFDIDKAIERQRKERELMFGIPPVNENAIIDDGESVGVRSETLAEQTEGGRFGEDTQVSDNTTDVDKINKDGEEAHDSKLDTLSGNAMYRFVRSALEGLKTLVWRKPKKEFDSMDRYFDWLDRKSGIENGVKMHNIIDYELGQIIKRNPHAKVKFLVLDYGRTNNAVKIAANDAGIKSHLIMVLDYDDSINKDITRIHNEKNGGVIEAMDENSFDEKGNKKKKKYLIIGNVGYGDQSNPDNEFRFGLFQNLWNSDKLIVRDPKLNLKSRAGAYFRAHPEDRFYVAQDVSTEIVPNSITPGWIVNKESEDAGPVSRDIRELIGNGSKSESNPHGLKIGSLKWGIQKGVKDFVSLGVSKKDVMVPRNKEDNLGRVFLLVPASNGKYLPIYIDTTKYNDVKENSELKQKINNNIHKLFSKDYNDRLDAAKALSRTFYLDKEHDFILVGKDGKGKQGRITFVKNGEKDKSFAVGSDFTEVMDYIVNTWNPRINITLDTLGNFSMSPTIFNMYADAGVLTTDVRILGTRGSFYSIYGLDSNGNMVIPRNPNNENPKPSVNSDFRNSNESTVYYRNKRYTESNGSVYLDGKLITDEDLANKIRYLNKINGGLQPVTTSKGWSYYIIDSAANIVVKVNDQEIQIANEEQAKKMIDKYLTDKDSENRDSNAEEKIKELEEKPSDSSVNKETGTPDDVTLPVDASVEGNGTIDEDTGDIDYSSDDADSVESDEEVTNAEDQTDDSADENTPVNQDEDMNLEESDDKSEDDTASLTELLRDRDYKNKLMPVIKEKAKGWGESFSNNKEAAELLQRHGIKIEDIEISGIDAWINALRCR